MLRHLLILALAVGAVFTADHLVRRQCSALREGNFGGGDSTYAVMAAAIEDPVAQVHTLGVYAAGAAGVLLLLMFALSHCSRSWERPDAPPSLLRALSQGLLSSSMLQFFWCSGLLVLIGSSGFAALLEYVAYGYMAQGGLKLSLIEAVLEVLCEAGSAACAVGALWLGPPSGWDGDIRPEWI